MVANIMANNDITYIMATEHHHMTYVYKQIWQTRYSDNIMEPKA